jgi:hypothetical protein
LKILQSVIVFEAYGPSTVSATADSSSEYYQQFRWYICRTRPTVEDASGVVLAASRPTTTVHVRPSMHCTCGGIGIGWIQKQTTIILGQQQIQNMYLIDIAKTMTVSSKKRTR